MNLPQLSERESEHTNHHLVEIGTASNSTKEGPTVASSHVMPKVVKSERVTHHEENYYQRYAG